MMSRLPIIRPINIIKPICKSSVSVDFIHTAKINESERKRNGSTFRSVVDLAVFQLNRPTPWWWDFGRTTGLSTLGHCRPCRHFATWWRGNDDWNRSSWLVIWRSTFLWRWTGWFTSSSRSFCPLDPHRLHKKLAHYNLLPLEATGSLRSHHSISIEYIISIWRRFY